MLKGEKLGQAIDSARRKKGVSKAQMARDFGIQPPSVSGWISNGRISKDKLQDLFSYFDGIVTPEHWGLTSESPFSVNEAKKHYNVSNGPDIKGYIPLISWVQAGDWAEAIDLYQPGDAESIHPTTVPHSLQTFALRVEGDSMTAPAGSPGHSFPNGMIIYVDPDQRGGVNAGDYVIAKHNGHGHVTFKQLANEEGRPVLRPLNTNGQYPIIRDEFDIIGKVIDASWGAL